MQSVRASIVLSSWFVLPLAVASAQPLQDDAEGASIPQEKLESWTAEILKDIEELREKTFPRAVSVAVATKAGFRDYAVARMEKSTSKEEMAADETLAKLLGLVDAKMDLPSTMMGFVESQVGGFYDPETEGFYLMDGFDGDLARIILAHELTHALDDQLYDIDGTLLGIEDNADAQFAYHAVVEGSGTAIMNLWTIRNIAELDPASLMKAQSMGAEEMAEAPPYLWKPMLATYLHGAAFLNRTANLLGASLGTPSLDDVHTAFTTPPVSSEQVLHPEKYWDQREDPVPVSLESSLPKGGGWRVVNENTLGELSLGLVVQPLDDRGGVDGMGALMGSYTYDASEGWGGDRYVLLGRDDARILVHDSVWDTERDRNEFVSAIEGLREHLAAAATATALARELDGAGVRLSTHRAGEHDVVRLVSWIGVDEEELGGVLAGVETRVGTH